MRATLDAARGAFPASHRACVQPHRYNAHPRLFEDFVRALSA